MDVSRRRPPRTSTSTGPSPSSNGSSISTEPLIRKPSASSESKTISYNESLRLVPWQTDNSYVLSGYRRQLFSAKACLWSSVSYLHNETVNIHTHSLGALFFAFLIPLHLFPTHFPTFPWITAHPTPTPPTTHDKLALTLNLLCAVTCLSLSSWFHTVQCHSKGMCDVAHRGDYIGIVVLIVGSVLPSMYYAFHGQLLLQAFYMSAILSAGIASAYIVLSPHHRSHRWHRTLTFISLGLSSVIPVAHILLTRGLIHARQTLSLDLTIMSGASYIFGALLYAARFPEQLRPGTFDYIGSSHQIFHLFVLVGAGCQYAALRGMVWGRSMAVGDLLAEKSM